MRNVAVLLLLFAAANPRDDIRKVIGDYVKAWLAGNPAAVMQLLTVDSVLVPGDKPPIVGAAALRNYWWPPNAPPFKLDRFESTIDDMNMSGDLATVRGTQVIAWTTGSQHWRTHGNYITVLRRTRGGWKIAVQMAANAQNESF